MEPQGIVNIMMTQFQHDISFIVQKGYDTISSKDFPKILVCAWLQNSSKADKL